MTLKHGSFLLSTIDKTETFILAHISFKSPIHYSLSHTQTGHDTVTFTDHGDL